MSSTREGVPTTGSAKSTTRPIITTSPTTSSQSWDSQITHSQSKASRKNRLLSFASPAARQRSTTRSSSKNRSLSFASLTTRRQSTAGPTTRRQSKASPTIRSQSFASPIASSHTVISPKARSESFTSPTTRRQSKASPTIRSLSFASPVASSQSVISPKVRSQPMVIPTIRIQSVMSQILCSQSKADPTLSKSKSVPTLGKPVFYQAARSQRISLASRRSLSRGSPSSSRDSSSSPESSSQSFLKKKHRSMSLRPGRLPSLRGASSSHTGVTRRLIRRSRKRRKSVVTTAEGDLESSLDEEVHRGPFLVDSYTKVSRQQSEEEEFPPERPDTDSEEYDTDLETDFKTPEASFPDITGKREYLINCDKLKVPSCSSFLRQSSKDTLKLRYYGLNAGDMAALAKGLKDNVFISTVDLAYNRIGPEGVISFAKALKENRYISHITLSYCFLGRSETGSRAVWFLVKNSYYTHYLDVSHNCFGNKDYKWFQRILLLQSRLYTLDIGDNEFSAGYGFEEFNNTLAECEVLEHLNLEWNPLSAVGARAVLKAIARNVNMRHVNLSHTGIDNSTLPELKELILCNDYLRTLTLGSNRLSESSILLLKDTLKKTRSPITIVF